MFGGHLWRLAIIAIDQFYVWLTSFHRPLSTCLHGCPRRCCSSRHGTRNPQELPKPASMVRPVSHQRLEARARPQEAIPSVFSIDSMASCDTRSQMSPCRTSSSSCHKLRGRREKDCAICIVAGGFTGTITCLIPWAYSRRTWSTGAYGSHRTALWCALEHAGHHRHYRLHLWRFVHLKIEYSTFEIKVLAFTNMWCLLYINTPQIFYQSILLVMNKGEVVHIYDWSV
jgi:hypothetical protein